MVVRGIRGSGINKIHDARLDSSCCVDQIDEEVRGVVGKTKLRNLDDEVQDVSESIHPPPYSMVEIKPMKNRKAHEMVTVMHKRINSSVSEDGASSKYKLSEDGMKK